MNKKNSQKKEIERLKNELQRVSEDDLVKLWFIMRMQGRFKHALESADKFLKKFPKSRIGMHVKDLAQTSLTLKEIKQ